MATVWYTNGFLCSQAYAFESQASLMYSTMNIQLSALDSDSSNPATLAAYQAALSAYTIVRNAQSSSVKAVKDIDSSIISNFH